MWGVWLDGVLYFGTGAGSVKARNLAANPALVVHLESGDKAVIMEGEAQWLTNIKSFSVAAHRRPLRREISWLSPRPALAAGAVRCPAAQDRLWLAGAARAQRQHVGALAADT